MLIRAIFFSIKKKKLLCFDLHEEFRFLNSKLYVTRNHKTKNELTKFRIKLLSNNTR